MKLDEFVALLEDDEPQGQGKATRYKCPSHGGHALSVDEGDEALLVICHGGCSLTEITDALGIHVSELFYNSRKKREPEAIYDYQDAEGNVLYQVVRFPGKDFKPRHYNPLDPDADSNGYVWELGEIERVLYKLPQIVASDPSVPVYVVDGEKDADALEKAGHVATCNSGGAGGKRGWVKFSYSDYLIERHVIIVVDKDRDAGRRHAETIRKALEGKAASIRMVQAKSGKDAADHLLAGHSVEEFVPLKERAKRGTATPRDLYEMVVNGLTTTEDSRSYFTNPWGLEALEWVNGRLYVLGAVTAGGKSSLAIQQYRHLCEEGRRPCLVTMEMSRADTANRLLAHKGFRLRDLERPWTQDEEWHANVSLAAAEWLGWEGSINFETSADAEFCAELIDSGEYDFLIFDHIHQIEKVAGGEEGNIAKEIRALRNIALDYDIPVLALSQFRRPVNPGELPAITNFKGSSAIEQNATMAMALHCLNGSTAYKLMILKNRDGRKDNYDLTFRGPRFSFENPDFQGGNDADRTISGLAEPSSTNVQHPSRPF